ncbi:hypothetical protein [Streptomyces alkaliterrae]|uniref:Uncharacterized protein n=1 Tax=Streptomyces alkaliterrae TaxID=2213162 RepID=A0A5P0YIV6_9ACTN|nr:hypothetical protein [Streptomyces alkaliterrae]MBB1251850.1 hypothetical protein [Streptomyces alkaliterrae]MBB1259309.1 hypothetical protein [Streptomyces alkaliterrae]MQS00313.1 hypothetical protein [Streptomyces alkaliterrae]
MTFAKEHATRLYAVLVAVLALVAHYVPSLPSALILGVAAAVLGTGEAVQRVENGKTVDALETAGLASRYRQ